MAKQTLHKEDPFLICQSDMIIAVVGPSGAGKSHLIDHLQNTSQGLGHVRIAKEGLKSIAVSLAAYRLKNHPTYGDKVVLVDTPGFDDTNLADTVILKMLEEWLDKTYRKSNKQTKIAGILYLHRITDNRMTGTANRNLAIFGRLCGADAAEKVIFVTTMWDRMAGKEATTESRVKHLQEKSWKDLIALGSRVEKFHNTAQSANTILARVCEGERHRRILQIQKELVKLGTPIKGTDAGATLYSTLQRLCKDHHDTLDSLMHEEATLPDLVLLKSFGDRQNQIEEQLQRILKDLEESKHGLFRRKLPKVVKASSKRSELHNLKDSNASIASSSRASSIYSISRRDITDYAMAVLRFVEEIESLSPIPEFYRLLQLAIRVVGLVQQYWPEERSLGYPLLFLSWFALTIANHTNCGSDPKAIKAVSTSIPSFSCAFQPLQDIILISEEDAHLPSRSLKSRRGEIDACSGQITIVCLSLASKIGSDVFTLRLSIFKDDSCIQAMYVRVSETLHPVLADTHFDESHKDVETPILAPQDSESQSAQQEILDIMHQGFANLAQQITMIRDHLDRERQPARVLITGGQFFSHTYLGTQPEN